MALLTLKDIGKIYVSENNVSVGIRGVNLSFDKGEFVAVTGKSGSGKSTLLNVISGMDTYEEGELFIEGNPTSHYLQSDWEEYRQKYISFIFQDYNIIESFTVLQNVELALMNIEDPKQRRARALELIDRVGLKSHINHRGSKLSGGQKQRTVIARALAKDSPIILADEPTGNLDSNTSKEITELLREVSKNKLVIVVTHNFEQLEKYATRHIRVFDSAVESDHVITEIEPAKTVDDKKENIENKEKKHKNNFKNGISLGKIIFASKPKLTIFLCILMLIGTMGIFFVTSLSSGMTELFKPSYIFNHIDGRVVVVKKDGSVISEKELEEISSKYGAKSYLHYDFLLDRISTYGFSYYNSEKECFEDMMTIKFAFDQNYGENIIGRYPEKDNEVFLYLPISLKPDFGEKEIKNKSVIFSDLALNVVGVKYYCDNNKTPVCVLTEQGFKNMSCAMYIKGNMNDVQFTLKVDAKGQSIYAGITPFVSYGVENGKVCVRIPEYLNIIKNHSDVKSALGYSHPYYSANDYTASAPGAPKFFKTEVDGDRFTLQKPSISDFENKYINDYLGYKEVFISPYLIREMVEKDLEENYKQASLFFENDKIAAQMAEKMQDDGFTAVTSDSTYVVDPAETLLTVISGVFSAIMWVIFIMFLGFFINLCSSRSMSAFKGDMAIMRSMGINVKTIKVGMYVRMFLSLIPAFLTVILTALLIFTTPSFNKHFMYMYYWQYLIIFAGMILLTARVTHKQIKKLFSESVKKSLKGGAHND